MYKRKLFFFGLSTAITLLVAMTFAAISAHLTRENLEQNAIAQSLLVEHQQLSSISYRLFKQLTDEVIFGQNANQAIVRNKQVLIQQTLDNIRRLEIQQREALGEAFTQGSVEDTDELELLLEEIVDEFRVVVLDFENIPISQQERLKRLLEVTIDDQFREAINSAVTRQSRVVAAINSKIDTLNTAMVWFTVVVGALALPLIVYACYWLFNQLYQPLVLIKGATSAIANGQYHQPISVKLDDEFQDLAAGLNQLAQRLYEHEENEAKSRRHLEFEVEQRTSELTNANLQLTKIDARRRQFIADISHEFRTPLTIIRGESQVTLRLKSPQEEDYRSTLKAILDQAVNLSRLVDDLLLLTRAEINQLQLEMTRISVSELLHPELQKWRRLQPDRKLSLNCEYPLEDVTITIDVPRIRQVLSILIDNAFKYSSDKGAIEVLVDDENESISIGVKDFGEGVSAAEVDSIFERFVRFSKHKEGLGLGLPIAKAIMEAHGGKIRVESVQGEGSTFLITLQKD